MLVASLLARAALAAEPAPGWFALPLGPLAPIGSAGAWPCPVAACDWAPLAPGLTLATDQHTRVTTDTPMIVPLRPGARAVSLVLLPVSGAVTGTFAKASWDGLPAAYRTDLVAGRHVWAATGAGGWDNVAGVPLGTGRTADGAAGALALPLGPLAPIGSAVTLSASAVGLTVPPGATALRVTTEGDRALAVLSVEQWTDGPPFPFTAEDYVAAASWAPFGIHQDGTLSLPRPAALGPIKPVTSPLRIDGERLVDGTGAPVRLYGTNVTLGWDLPSPEDSRKLAEGMAALGVNHLRFNVFPMSREALYRTGRFRAPTDEEWARFDALVDALAANGIRMQLPLVDVDQQWGRQTPEAVIERAHTTDLEPIFDAQARAAQKEAIRAVLGHVHPRRGLPLAKDPVLGVVEISNEAGLVWEWPSVIGISLTARQRDALRARWNDWLRARYADDAALAAAWADASAPNAVMPGESLADGTVALEPYAPWRWSTWSRGRRADLMGFLDALDSDYWSEMRRFLVEELGTTALVVGTQHVGSVAASRQQAAMGLGDAHYQFDHPNDSPMEQARTSLLAAPIDKRLRTVANSAVRGQPFTVGEFNQGWPSPYEYEMPLLWATLGARQGWDGTMWFTWDHKPWKPQNPGRILGQMDVYGNPVKMGQMLAAAAVLRGGLVPEADGLSVTHLPDAAASSPRFPQPLPTPGPGDGQFLLDHRLRTDFGADVPAYAPALPMGARGPSGSASQPAGAARPAVWADGALVVDAPGAPIVVSPGAEHATAHLVAGGGPGAVSVVGIDAVPLAEARRWLLTVATRALNTGYRELVGDDEPTGHTIGNLGEGPILLAPYAGRVGLRGGRGTPTVTRLGPQGAPAERVPVKRRGDTWWVDLGAVPPGTWFTVDWG